jgi:type IV pilus assembly protein PilY1
MVFGRVMIGGKEKWVGFVGGGYTLGTPKEGTAGKGFFVVDLDDGGILWAYTCKDDAKMDYIPGSPAIFDRDNDGFIDTAYVGDLAGNLWKFSFCRFNPCEEEAKKCDESKWTGKLLYDPGTTKIPIFTTPAVAKDTKGNAWLFWGTGDRVHPNQDRGQNSFFALKDSDLGVTYALGNLQDISSSVFNIKGPSNQGWYIRLTGQERVLSDATVFRGIVFFTSYTPPAGEFLCGATGTGALYGIAMMEVAINESLYAPGEGVFS